MPGNFASGPTAVAFRRDRDGRAQLVAPQRNSFETRKGAVASEGTHFAAEAAASLPAGK